MRGMPRNLYRRLRFAAGAFFVPRIRSGLAHCAVYICSWKDAKPQGISAQQVKSHAQHVLFFALHRSIRLASASSRGAFFMPQMRVGLAQCAACICSRKEVKPQGISVQRDISHARRVFFFAPHHSIRLAHRFFARKHLCAALPLWIGRTAPISIHNNKKLREPKPSQS